ncbi:Vacuolar protein sorting-associated protein 13, partial [Smittium mucronatum]
MLEGVIARVLNTFLGGYVDNLETKQLNIGIWKGDVTFRNLSLRKDALDSIDLPLDITEGNIGTLSMTIPWSNLKAQPVVITVEDVSMTCILSCRSSMSKEQIGDALTRELAQKMKKLKQFDLQLDMYTGQSEKSIDNSYYGLLVAKIIDNLQIKIKNIHLKYVDSESNSDHPFILGAVLSSLSIVSTNEDWTPMFVEKSNTTIFKKLDMKNLYLYLDNDSNISKGKNDQDLDLDPSSHNSIINPVAGIGKLTINKTAENGKGKTDLSLEFDQFSLSLDDFQYQDFLLLITKLDYVERKKKYSKFLPDPYVSVHENPGAWLSFAINSILSEVKESRERWDWVNIKRKCQMRRDYVKLYTLLKTSNALDLNQKKNLDDLERELSYMEIMLFRSIALPSIKKYKVKKMKEEKKKENSGQNAKPSTSWLSGWANWAAGSNPNSSDPESALITDSDISDLYEALELEPEQDFDYNLIQDGTTINATLSLDKCYLELKNNSFAKSQTLISITGRDVKVDLYHLCDNSRINLTVHDFFVNDGTVTNSTFSKMVKIRENVVSNTNNTLPFLKVNFEQNPEHKNSDSVVIIKAQPLDIVFNPDVIIEVQKFFKPPSSSIDSVKYLVEAASRSITGFQNQTKSGLQYALETHKRLDLQVDFQAPLIIVPMDISDPNCGVTVLDLGHLTILSEMASSDSLKGVDLNPKKMLSKEEMATLKTFLYDWLKVKLEKLQLIVGPDLESCSKSILNEKTEKNKHVVDKIELDFKLGLCILKERPLYMPQIMIDGHLPALQVYFSDYKYRRIMETVDIILKVVSSDDVSDSNPEISPNVNSMTYPSNFIDLNLENIPTPGKSSSEDSDPEIEDSFLNQNNFSPSSNDKKSPNMDFMSSGVIGTSMMSSFSKKVKLNVVKSSPEKNNAESDSIANSDSDHDSDGDQFFDTLEDSKGIAPQAIKTSNSGIVSPSEPKKPKEINYEQENIMICFKVDKLMVGIYEYQDSQNLDDLLLCNVEISQFMIDIKNREYDMAVGIVIHEIKAEDLMTKLAPTSDTETPVRNYIFRSDSNNNDQQYQSDLFTISYSRLQIGHPNFLLESKPSGQTVDMNISSIHFTIIRKSILKLYNFVLNTFVGNEPGTEPNLDLVPSSNDINPNIGGQKLAGVYSKDISEASNMLDIIPLGNNNLPLSSDSPEIMSAFRSISVNINLIGIDLNLCDDLGNSIALLALTEGTTSLRMSDELNLEAKIGGFSLIDTINMNPNLFISRDISKIVSDRKIMYITGKELLNLGYKTFVRDGKNYPGYDSFLNLNVGEMHLVFVKDTIQKLMDFGTKFAEMHELFESARRNVAESATQITETVVQGSYKTKIKIVMSAPVISFLKDGLMPVMLEDKRIFANMVVAELGQLSITNDFETVSETSTMSAEVNSFSISLNKLNVLSKFYYHSSQSEDPFEQNLSILEDVTFFSVVKIVIGDRNGQGIIPDTKITSSIDKLSVMLSNQQYKFFLDMIQVISETFIVDPVSENVVLESEFNNVFSDPNLNSSQIKNSISQNLTSNLSKNPNQTQISNKPSLKKDFDQSQNKFPKKNPIMPPLLDFSLDIPTIRLELFENDMYSPLDIQKSTFTRLNLTQINLKYRLKASGSSIAELCVGKVRAFDTRMSSQSYYKQFVGPRDEPYSNPTANSKVSKINDLGKSNTGSINNTLDFPQFVAHVDMSPGEPNVVRATLDNPRIILALDHVFQVLNFFQSPFIVTDLNTGSGHSHVSDQITSTAPAPNDPVMVLKVNIISPEIIMLADPKSISSEALIISVREICFSMDNNYGSTIDDIRMVLCRMDVIKSSSRIIMDPLSIVAQININRIRPDPSSGISSSEIINATFEVGELVLKIGLHDIALIQNVVNQFNALMAKTYSGLDESNNEISPGNSKSNSPNQKSESPQSSNQSPSVANANSSNEAPIATHSFKNYKNITSQLNSEKAIMTVNGVHAIIIHDRFDMSILDLSLSKFSVSASDWSSQLEVSSGMKLSLSYFDFHNSHWEQLIETWPFIVNVQCEIPDSERVLPSSSNKPSSQITTVTLGSKSRIEINAPHSGIEALVDLFLHSKHDVLMESIKSKVTDFSNDIELFHNLSKSVSINSNTDTQVPDLNSSSGTTDGNLANLKIPKLSVNMNYSFSQESSESEINSQNVPKVKQDLLNVTSPNPDSKSPTTDSKALKSVSSDPEGSQYVFSRGQKHPYLITNLTGLNCHIWVDLPEGATLRKKDDLVPVLLSNGSSIPWSFQNWRLQKGSSETHSNQLGVQFSNGMWEWVRRISVDREGVNIFRLSPDVDGITYLLAVEVFLDVNQFLKIVTLRSTLVVENKTMIPIELSMCNYKGEDLSDVMVIKPNDKFPLPLLLCHQNAFKIRPEYIFGYNWSRRYVYWRDFLSTKPQRIASCSPMKHSNNYISSFNFHFTANFDSKNPNAYKFPLMDLVVSSPLEIENLLPYSIQFRIFDKTDNCDWSNVLPSGDISSVHSVKPANLILMSMNVPEAKFIRSGGAVIDSFDFEEYPLDSEIIVYDPNGQKLTLKILRAEINYTNGACFRVSIISPYVLINRTESSLYLKSKSFLRVSSDIAGQQTIEEQDTILAQTRINCKREYQKLNKDIIRRFLSDRSKNIGNGNGSNNQPNLLNPVNYDSEDSDNIEASSDEENFIRPLMFSYGGFDVRNRVILQSGLSEWSKPISLDTVGQTGEVVLLSKSRPVLSDMHSFSDVLPQSTAHDSNSEKFSYVHLGIQITPGASKFSNSVFVLISPRYVVKNNSGLPLLIREYGVSDSLSLGPGKRSELQYLSKEFDSQLTISIDVESVYSMLESIGETVRNKQITAVSGGRAWSSPFLMDHVGKVYIRLPKPQALASYEAPMHKEKEVSDDFKGFKNLTSVPIELTTILLSVDIVMDGAVLFILIQRETGEWPYRIDNLTGLEISFFQSLPVNNGGYAHSGAPDSLIDPRGVGELFTSKTKSSTMNNFDGVPRNAYSFVSEIEAGNAESLRWYTVVGYHSMPYAWDYPSIDPKSITLKVCNSYRVVSLFEIGTRPPMPVSYQSHKLFKGTNKSIYLYIEIVAQGNQQVLRLTSNLQAQGLSPEDLLKTNIPMTINDISQRQSYGNRDSMESKISSVFEPSDPVEMSINSETQQPSNAISNPQNIYGDTSIVDIPTFNLALKLEGGIGISLISRNVEEIMYASFSGVSFKVQISDKSQAISLDIKWIQIDNQLYGALYPIVLYPTSLSNSNSDSSKAQVYSSNNQNNLSLDNNQFDLKPVFQAAIVWVSDSYSNKYNNNYNLGTSENSPEIQHIKFASILLQELSIELDEDFLTALLDFSILDFTTFEDKDIGSTNISSPNFDAIVRVDSNIALPNTKPKHKSKIQIAPKSFGTIFDPEIYRDNADDETHLDEVLFEISKAYRISGVTPNLPFRSDISNGFYFDLLMLQPMKLNISFLRTGRVVKSTASHTTENPNSTGYQLNPIEYTMNVFTMAVGNVNEVPIYLNALILENMRVSMEGLIDRLSNFYRNEFMSQLLKFVGSADVLGNPVGLFNNITSGVIDIFYEPYQGIMMSDRPQDIGIGLAKGTASFFKKTVYGLSDSFTRFTDSVGKGLSAATMDSEYQDMRRLDKIRNRPRHALLGVATGAESFAKSISSGIAGVVLQPLHGAERDGMGGFFKGVGIGMIGVVAKPLVGLLDMMSNVTEGIRNTTTVFDSSEIDRIRLPRFINKQKIIEPYSNRDSLGFNWMREIGDGRFAFDDYLAHLELANSDLVVLLTYQHLLMFKRNKTSKTIVGAKSNMTSEASLTKSFIEWEVEIRKLHVITMESGGISVKLPNEFNASANDSSPVNIFNPAANPQVNSINNANIGVNSVQSPPSSLTIHDNENSAGKDLSPGIFIPISDEVNKRWFFGKIKEA